MHDLQIQNSIWCSVARIHCYGDSSCPQSAAQFPKACVGQENCSVAFVSSSQRSSDNRGLLVQGKLGLLKTKFAVDGKSRDLLFLISKLPFSGLTKDTLCHTLLLIDFNVLREKRKMFLKGWNTASSQV